MGNFQQENIHYVTKKLSDQIMLLILNGFYVIFVVLCVTHFVVQMLPLEIVKGLDTML